MERLQGGKLRKPPDPPWLSLRDLGFGGEGVRWGEVMEECWAFYLCAEASCVCIKHNEKEWLENPDPGAPAHLVKFTIKPEEGERCLGLEISSSRTIDWGICALRDTVRQTRGDEGGDKKKSEYWLASLGILVWLIDLSQPLIRTPHCLSASSQKSSDTKRGFGQLMVLLSFEHWRLEKVFMAYSKDHSWREKRTLEWQACFSLAKGQIS